MQNNHVFDVLVLGSGAAGLSLALHLAGRGWQVAVLSKNRVIDGSTLYAQGGISAVLDRQDTLEAHVCDTLVAGAGLCHEDAVRFTVERGPQAIDWLIERGVPFTRAEASTDGFAYHLNREGGHSHRRIIHAADATGRAVETTLESLARAEPRIQIFEHHIAVDLIVSRGGDRRCTGAYVLNIPQGRVKPFAARALVLATGGANMAYLYSTNRRGSTGDGIAMAWRAGCRIANMEFMQFHPTCLYHPASRAFLISEAVRGEGGRLLLPDGMHFMPAFDVRAELAPRDIVARAIDHEMKRLGIDHVLLDISHRPADFVRAHFPSIYRHCLSLGLDITRDPIPVVPAAHYTCGGVMTDLSGHTDLPGLYAIGETAHTGLHGANRMASNSLLECLVFAESASVDLERTLPELALLEGLRGWDESRVTDSDEEVVVSHNWAELRRFMWDYVGIVRTSKRLQRARNRINLLQNEIQEYYGNFRVTANLIELRNLVQVADLIVASAMSRHESRGLHYTLDYPETAEQAWDTVLTPGCSSG